jgi:hypothetical protein
MQRYTCQKSLFVVKTETLEKNIYRIQTAPAWSLWEQGIYAALCGIGVGVIIVFGSWWFSLAHIPSNFAGPLHVFDWVLFALLSYVLWYQLGMELLTWWTGFGMRHPVPVTPLEGMSVALVTAFVPGAEPYDMLEQTLAAMKAVRYPHDTWVLDEGNDRIVRALCRRLGVYHFSREGFAKFNAHEGHFKAKTKAGNFNAWFARFGYAYEFVAQHDVDFAPTPQYLDRTLGYFRDPAVAFVGTPQIYGNTERSWIARAAAEQAYGFYGPMQKGFFGMGMQLFIGANHVMRTRAHNDIEGYSGHIVEDHLTGMRLYANRWKSVYVPEILLVGEGPETWEAYFSQQLRWAYGLIDILLRHSPRIVSKMQPLHAFNYLLLQQYYFYGVAQAIGLFLITLFFTTGIYATTMDTTTLLAVYPLCIIMQLLVYLWTQRAYIDPVHESGFHLRGKMLTIAAWPIYLIACLGALVGKRISYVVTPKGEQSASLLPSITIFAAHITIGSIAALCVFISFVREMYAPMLVFWAIVTAVCMFYFPLANSIERMLVTFSFVRNGYTSGIVRTLCLAIVAGALVLWSGTVMALSLPAQSGGVVETYREIVLNDAFGIVTSFDTLRTQ